MQDDVKEFLLTYVLYDKDTGQMSWKKPIKRRKKIETPHGKYRAICVNTESKARVLSHRAAWFLHYREDPPKAIDHIDGNPANNSISNLRAATATVNSQNRWRGSGKSGLLGVTVRNDGPNIKFRASIRVAGKLIQLGTYKTAEEAHEVYLSAKKTYHKEGNVIATDENTAKPIMKISSTGEKWIYKNRDGFQVKFNVNGKNLCFGTHRTLEEAIKIRELVLGGKNEHQRI
jgi:hypothetical protein